MIYPLSPDSGNGWIHDKSLCDNKTGGDFIQCIDEMSYSAEDLINNYDSDNFRKKRKICLHY